MRLVFFHLNYLWGDWIETKRLVRGPDGKNVKSPKREPANSPTKKSASKQSKVLQISVIQGEVDELEDEEQDDAQQKSDKPKETTEPSTQAAGSGEKPDK